MLFIAHSSLLCFFSVNPTHQIGHIACKKGAWNIFADLTAPQLDESTKEVAKSECMFIWKTAEGKKHIKCSAALEATELIASVPVELLMVGDLVLSSLALRKEELSGCWCC